MPSIVAPHEPTVADAHEAAAVTQLARLLDSLGIGQHARRPRLRGPDGDEAELPETILGLLRLVTYHLERGDSVTLTPLPKDLTTFQAASLLDISVVEFEQLLKQGVIPFTETPHGARIPLAGLLAYKQGEKARQRQALAELTQLSQELGLYDEDVEATPVEVLHFIHSA